MAHIPDRPLSPHLTAWRWHVTMFASIAHRISGVALYVGALGLAVWLTMLASGGETFAAADEFLRTPLGQIGLYALVAAFGYHLLNGIRHLFWDIGMGFKPTTANQTAWGALFVGAIGVPLALYMLLAAAP